MPLSLIYGINLYKLNEIGEINLIRDDRKNKKAGY